MTRRSTYLCLALLGGLLLLVLLSPQHSLPRQLLLGESSLPESGSSLKEDGPPTKTAGTLRKTDPSIEETTRLLHTIILAELEIEHLSLKRTVGHLNQLIQDVGVDPEKLQLQLNHQNGNIATSRVKGLRLVNSSLASILTEIGDQTATTLQVTPHLVELVGSDDPDAMTERKLDDIIAPIIDYDETTLLEARDHLRSRSRELDSLTLDPKLKGVMFIIRPDAANPDFEDSIITTLKARNYSLRMALNTISGRAGARWTVENGAVIISPDPNPTAVHIHRRLAEIIVPKLDFEDTSLEEAIDFLRQCSREMDPAKEPEQKGFSIVLRKPRIEEPADSAIDPNRPTHTQTLTFQVEHISVAEALDRITVQTGMRWTIDQHAIKIVPLPYQEDP